MTDPKTLADLIVRLARLEQAEAWQDDLNPAQRATLGYLARANRFSRAPSQVADYLGTTRGTASQTLKALRKKGLVIEAPVAGDRRALHCTLTPAGRAALERPGALEPALAGLGAADRAALAAALGRTLHSILAARHGRPFGVCAECRHFEPRAAGGFCKLLSAVLDAQEITQICHEQTPRAA